MSDLLFGMNNIRPVAGNLSDVTILKLKREYPSFPIEKLEGTWVGDRETIKEWFKMYSKGEVPGEERPEKKKSKAKSTKKPKTKIKAARGRKKKVSKKPVKN